MWENFKLNTMTDQELKDLVASLAVAQKETAQQISLSNYQKITQKKV